MRKDSQLKFSLLVIFLVGLFLIGFFESKNIKREKLYNETKFYLGSIVELKFYCSDDLKAKRISNAIFQELNRLEKKYSTHSKESYLSKLNSGYEELKTIDDETLHLLKLCDSAYRITRKKFDPSIGKITNYWNNLIEQQNEINSKSHNDFQQVDQKQKSKIFNDELLKSFVMNSGWEKVNFAEDKKLSYQNLWLTLDGIVQGYAADRAISILKSNGINKALVNVGGEIKVLGEWKIGIKHPRIPNEIIEKLNVKDLSVATSGDYEKFFVFNGKRFHHIIDPETGYPSNKNSSITIIAKDCAFADALSTGFFSLEPDSIIKIIESLKDVEAFIVDSQGKIYSSKGFEKYLWR
ncbi:MAG: FAD:protein FMN transferase [Ignavibacteria bacterium]|nr:FAD:protein FMN transferase [Ignavibacteria bacterium]